MIPSLQPNQKLPLTESKKLILNKDELKVEQALLDLNELKSEVYKDKKENSYSETSMRRTPMHQKMQRTHISETQSHFGRGSEQGFGITKQTAFSGHHSVYDELTAD